MNEFETWFANLAGGNRPHPWQRAPGEDAELRDRLIRIPTGFGKHAEDGLWLTPLARCQVGEPLANKTFTPDDYLTLLDATGRLLKAGKRGVISSDLEPILARLDMSVDAWLATMLGWRMFAFTSALGHAKVCAVEAKKRGLQWIRNRCPLFAETSAKKGSEKSAGRIDAA